MKVLIYFKWQQLHWTVKVLTTTLDDDSAEAIISDIIQGKDRELYHTTVSNSQLSDFRGNESHPAKRARIEACKGIEKQGGNDCTQYSHPPSTLYR